jgi:hypothetical protein
MKLNATFRWIFALLAVLTLVAVAVVAHPLSASASTTYTLYSTDRGGRVVFTLTWNSSTRATVAWDNYDVKADGKGPYFEMRKDDDCTIGAPTIINHNTRGNGWDAASTTSLTAGCDSLVHIDFIECNGGSGSNCDDDFIRNPLAG